MVAWRRSVAVAAVYKIAAVGAVHLCSALHSIVIRPLARRLLFLRHRVALPGGTLALAFGDTRVGDQFRSSTALVLRVIESIICFVLLNMLQTRLIKSAVGLNICA